MPNVSISTEYATLASCEALHAQLIEAVGQGAGLQFDLSATQDMDLTGLQLVLATARAAGEAGQALVLAPTLSPAAAKAFARAGLDPVTLGPVGPSLEAQ